MTDLLILIVVLSLVIYRIGRFITLDDLIEEPRNWFFRKVLVGWDPDLGRMRPYLEREPEFTSAVSLWRRKLGKLVGCPFCVTAYISAGACLATRIFVGSFPMPVWVWLASWAGSLVWWSIIDSE